MSQDEPPRYRSYMLRVWEIRSHSPERPSTWRFSLEDPHTGQRHAFPGLEALIAFLKAELMGNVDDAV